MLCSLSEKRGGVFVCFCVLLCGSGWWLCRRLLLGCEVLFLGAVLGVVFCVLSYLLFAGRVVVVWWFSVLGCVLKVLDLIVKNFLMG